MPVATHADFACCARAGLPFFPTDALLTTNELLDQVQEFFVSGREKESWNSSEAMYISHLAAAGEIAGRESFVCRLPVRPGLHLPFGSNLLKALETVTGWVEKITDNLLPLLSSRDSKEVLAMPAFLEINYFQALETHRDAHAQCRFRAHTDPGLFSLLPFGSDRHLEWRDREGVWQPNSRPDQMMVFAGNALETLSRNQVSSLCHRVMISGEAAARPRVSALAARIPPPGPNRQ